MDDVVSAVSPVVDTARDVVDTSRDVCSAKCDLVKEVVELGEAELDLAGAGGSISIERYVPRESRVADSDEPAYISSFNRRHGIRAFADGGIVKRSWSFWVVSTEVSHPFTR